MQHSHCTHAIHHLMRGNPSHNVSKNQEECACEHNTTGCDWVGNGIHFACLSSKATATQRVYTSFSGTKAARIESPRHSPSRGRT